MFVVWLGLQKLDVGALRNPRVNFGSDQNRTMGSK
jgi:hypothetical protein